MGSSSGALRYPHAQLFSYLPASGGRHDWLRADGSHTNWLLGPEAGPEPAPRTFKWEGSQDILADAKLCCRLVERADKGSEPAAEART